MASLQCLGVLAHNDQNHKCCRAVNVRSAGFTRNAPLTIDEKSEALYAALIKDDLNISPVRFLNKIWCFACVF